MPGDAPGDQRKGRDFREGAVGVWVVVQLRAALFVLAIVGGVRLFALRFVDQTGLIVLGILWLVGVGLLEAYLRVAQTPGQLRARVVRVILVEGGLFALAYGLQVALV